MGFGLCVLGYLLIGFDAFGGGIIGYPLFAYGLYKVSSTHRFFLYAGMVSLLLTTDSVVNLLAILKIISDTSTLYLAIHTAAYGFRLLMLGLYFLAVKSIAEENKAERLRSKAVSRFYLTAVVYLFTIAVSLFPAISAGGLSVYIYVAGIAVWLLNIIFMYDCYAKISTPRQIALDRQKLHSIEQEDMAKKAKRQRNEGSDK